MSGRPSRKRKVLSEDEYLGRLGAILKRDYFPDLERLQAQKDLLTAVEQSDLLALQLATERLDRVSESDELTSADGMSLDEFQSRFTTEDDASFDDILERFNAKQRERFAKLHGGPPLLRAPPDRRLLLAPSISASEPEKGKETKISNTRFKRPYSHRDKPSDPISHYRRVMEENDDPGRTPQLSVGSSRYSIPSSRSGSGSLTEETPNRFRMPPTPSRETTANNLLQQARSRSERESAAIHRIARKAKQLASIQQSPFGGALRTPKRGDNLNWTPDNCK